MNKLDTLTPVTRRDAHLKQKEEGICWGSAGRAAKFGLLVKTAGAIWIVLDVLVLWVVWRGRDPAGCMPNMSNSIHDRPSLA